jgi:pseudaminic acid cytidylyltransferase
MLSSAKIAIIPARGGSKRIARKNIKPFHGLPIIAHSIRTAKASGLFDVVMVTTDDPEIAGVALDHGAEVPFMRPAELSGDHAGTLEVITHALKWYADQGREFMAACCLYATAPFVRREHLEEGWEKISTGEKSYAFAVTGFDYPIQRALKLTADGGVDMVWPEHRLTRSQDLEATYHDAGQFYWGRSEAFLGQAPIFAPHAAPVILPRKLVHDIDTLEDWEAAELAYGILYGGKA